MTDNTCSICLEEMTDGHPNGIKTLIHPITGEQAGHYAHKKCICIALRSNPICPICRVHINNINELCKEMIEASKRLRLLNDLYDLGHDYTPTELAEIGKLNQMMKIGGKKPIKRTKRTKKRLIKKRRTTKRRKLK
jgi:hypothetical protein